MTFLLSLFTSPAYIDLPQSLVGRLIVGVFWVLGVALLVLFLRRWRAFHLSALGVGVGTGAEASESRF